MPSKKRYRIVGGRDGVTLVESEYGYTVHQAREIIEAIQWMQLEDRVPVTPTRDMPERDDSPRTQH